MTIFRICVLVYFAIGAFFASFYILSVSLRSSRIVAKAIVSASGVDPSRVDNFLVMVRGVVIAVLFWPYDIFRMVRLFHRVRSLSTESQRVFREDIEAERVRMEAEEEP